MERREQYDPEDIESLLSERSFDELLEEERAYVLRHLANRDEYETMRALLYQVRSDERNEGRITAPPEVRTHVLDVFRQQQQPQWRVWLNSVGGLLWPKEMSAIWRPALALGSVAILITAGVFLFRQADAGPVQLAEVKPVTAPETDKEQAAIMPSLDSVSGNALSSTIAHQDEAPVRELETINGDGLAGYAEATIEEEPASSETLGETTTGATVQTFDMATVTNAEAPTEDAEKKSLVTDDARQQSAGAPASVPHQVTEAEFARNESLANATSRSQTMTKRKLESAKEVSADSRNLGEDAALVSLINSGW